MTLITRRAFTLGLLAAPAIIPASRLMSVVPYQVAFTALIPTLIPGVVGWRELTLADIVMHINEDPVLKEAAFIAGATPLTRWMPRS